MGFKERLKDARASSHLTGEELGAQLGVSKQTISHWEAGRYEPNIEQIRGLCKALRITPNYLFEADDLRLPPDAIAEAKLYAALSENDKRRWRTIRSTMFATAG